MPETLSLNRTIEPLIGSDFQLSVTMPCEKPQQEGRNTVPITLHLSRNGIDSDLGCYMYTIPSKRTESPFHQTLLNNAEEKLFDITKRMGGLISKKYNVPSYVSLSGAWELDDLIPAIREVTELIESQW